MALADEIVSRYRSGGAGPAPSAPAEADGGEEKSEAQIAAGRALIAAVKRGDAAAVCEAVRAIAAEY